LKILLTIQLILGWTADILTPNRLRIENEGGVMKISDLVAELREALLNAAHWINNLNGRKADELTSVAKGENK
jgi:hypothetical protein